MFPRNRVGKEDWDVTLHFIPQLQYSKSYKGQKLLYCSSHPETEFLVILCNLKFYAMLFRCFFLFAMSSWKYNLLSDHYYYFEIVMEFWGIVTGSNTCKNNKVIMKSGLQIIKHCTSVQYLCLAFTLWGEFQEKNKVGYNSFICLILDSS